MAKDMTHGSLTGILIRFSMPLIMSGMLQQLYGWVDAFVVGNFDGEKSLAAIGVTNAVSQFFIFSIMGFSSGISILSARYHGNGDKREEKQRRLLSSFTLILGSMSAALAALFIVLSDKILIMLDTPHDIFVSADTYLVIILLGIPFLSVYNVYSAVLRGMGDSRAPFYAVLISTIVNAALDVFFVAGLGLGVKGAAAATVISQVLMTVFIIAYSGSVYRELHFEAGAHMIDTDIVKEGFRLSIPITIQSVVTSVGNLVLQNFMNSFGTAAVAAITTAYRVDSVIMLPIVNLGTGISTVVAQNEGAGDRKRTRESLFAGLRLMTVVSLILSVIILSFAGQLIGLFGLTQESTGIGKDFFRSLAPFYILFGICMAMRGYREGVGDVVFSGANGIFSLLVRIVLSYILKPVFGTMVIAYAEAASWCAMLILYLIRSAAVTAKDRKHKNTAHENIS